MKKILSLSLIALVLFAAPLAISAEEGDQQEGYKEIPQEGQLIPTIQVIGNWLFSLLMAVAAIAIIIAAFLFITSGGDPDKVATARQWVIYALAGVIVALLAQVLVNWASDMVQQ